VCGGEGGRDVVVMVERRALWRMMKKWGIIISRTGEKLGVMTYEENQKEGKEDSPI
jgi:hypothetical protein